MASKVLNMREPVSMKNGRMILGFSGWMDGGEVSTGTVEYLRIKLRSHPVADIAPEPFFIYSFPGSMEMAAMFRPEVCIADGIITSYDSPESTFHANPLSRVVLFESREPNLDWPGFAEAILEMAAHCNVHEIFFVGSVAGIVPHTRDPRIHASISEPRLRPMLEQHGLEPTNYEGPASFITYLMERGPEVGVRVMTLVAEIPAYVQGKNVRCIEAMVRKLATILDLDLDIGDLKTMSLEFKKRLNEAVQERPDLAELLHKMETDYDREVLDAHMDDLRDWFEKQGFTIN